MAALEAAFLCLSRLFVPLTGVTWLNFQSVSSTLSGMLVYSRARVLEN